MTAAYYYRRPGDPLPEGYVRKPPKSAEEKAADRARALEIWRDARPIFGTPAEAYLRGRGLLPDCALYPDDGSHWPETLRYSDDLHRLPKPPHEKGLVCAVNKAAGGLVVAIHRVSLYADGRPIVEDGRKKKLSLGPVRGNAWRGSMWPDPAGRWGLAEGVETALAATQLMRFPVWAAISAGNMANIVPPSWARHGYIFGDNDPPDAEDFQPGIEAAADARETLQDRLESVRVILADIGKDMGDILKEVPYAR